MRLVDALRRQRAHLKRLLIAAEVPVADGEAFLLDALGEKSAAEWECVEDIDGELLACVGRAWARYAESRGRADNGQGAHEGHPRPGRDGPSGKKRRRRP